MTSTALFWDTKSRQSTASLGGQLVNAFARKPEKITGVYLGRNRIQVQGQQYTFRNETGIAVNTGDSIPVTNVGRKAAAVYAPVSGYGTIAGSGGSSTSTTTALADHVHDGTANSGGALFTAASMAFVLDGVTATVRAALLRLDTRSMMEKSSVDTGDALTVPAGWQILIDGPYTVDGTITIDGKVVIL